MSIKTQDKHCDQKMIRNGFPKTVQTNYLQHKLCFYLIHAINGNVSNIKFLDRTDLVLEAKRHSTLGGFCID